MAGLEACRIAAAMAKSRLVLSLGTSAGAKLIVIRLRGRLSLQLAKALRIRSLASPTALLPRPTITIAGRLLETWHSTSIAILSEPTFKILWIDDFTAYKYAWLPIKVKARLREAGRNDFDFSVLVWSFMVLLDG